MRIGNLALVVALTAVLAGATPALANNEPPPPQPVKYTERVSVSSSETQANATSSDHHAISATGRYVAFSSWASNLVSGDTNGRDVFVRDRSAGTTVRVSITSRGGQANGNSSQPAISDDGRYVAFVSAATNLSAGDTNGQPDVFRHDRDTGLTVRVSVEANGAQLPRGGTFPSISADGRYVAFTSFRPDDPADEFDPVYSDVFVKDMSTGSLVLASPGLNGPALGISQRPSISADGRYVAFESDASNLAFGDNGGMDVWRRDLLLSETFRVSVGVFGASPNGGSWAASISDDGNRVAFESGASNLVSSDTNNTGDIFVRDVNASTTTRASVIPGSSYSQAGARPSISGDGTRVLFDAYDVYEIVYVRNLTTSTTTKVSVTNAGTAPNSMSFGAALSGNGRYAVFTSSATNLVDGDTNGYQDAFVRYF